MTLMTSRLSELMTRQLHPALSTRENPNLSVKASAVRTFVHQSIFPTPCNEFAFINPEDRPDSVPKPIMIRRCNNIEFYKTHRGTAPAPSFYCRSLRGCNNKICCKCADPHRNVRGTLGCLLMDQFTFFPPQILGSNGDHLSSTQNLHIRQILDGHKKISRTASPARSSSHALMIISSKPSLLQTSLAS